MALRTLPRALDLLRQLLLPRRWPGLRRYLQRLLLPGLLLPILLLLQLLHWLCLLLDELLFPDYRLVEIRRPLFVLGVPRSGTTYLHRLIAEDPRFTSLTLWECLFAPSITERRLLLGLAALDRRVGAPLGRLVLWMEDRILKSLDDVHATRLSSAEEDYMLLLPLLCCFILVVAFPESRWLWRMARFDQEVAPDEQQLIMDWYRRCLQRHLYVHGPERTLLSKNAAFAGMAGSLAQTFPDAIFAVCQRDARQVIGSQFNALAEGLRLFGIPEDEPAFRGRLLDALLFYYENLERLTAGDAGERVVTVSARELATAPRAAVETLLAARGMQPGPALDGALRAAEDRGSHRPLRQPSVARWGIDELSIARRFGPWCRSDARL
jgi:hypothetical protein